MTVSTHTYTAVLLGSPNVPLLVRGGSVTLDESRAPHVEAQLQIALPNLATLVALDPRLGKRIRLTATSTMTGSRTFDLVLTARVMMLAAGTVQLNLASDETLLAGYAPLADIDLYDRANDIKALAAYVVGVVLGAAPTISGPTADLTPYWDATNLIRNPSFETDLTLWGWTGATTERVNDWSASNPWAMRLTSGGSIDSFAYPDGDVGGIRSGMSPGRTYTAQAEYRIGGSALGGSAGPRARRIVAFVKAPSLGPGYVEYASDPMPNTVNTRRRLGVTFDLPADTTEAFIRLYNGHTDGSVWIDAVSLTSDSRHTTYFDGSVPATPGYLYFWTGEAHKSTSQRHPLVESADPDAFLWRAGQSALDFLVPLVQAAGLRLVCDETRSWSMRGEGYAAPGTLTIRHGINLIDGDDTISRDDDSWFDAAITRYEWTDRYGVKQTRVDAYGVAGYTRAREFTKTTPYPGPGFSEYAVRRAKTRGRQVTGTIVTDWQARAEQAVIVTLSGAPVQTGRIGSVQFDLDNDRVTATTRTVDTPIGAIDLLTGTVNGLSGQINNL